MNNERRATLKKAIDHLNDGLALVEEVNQEEADAYDNMPEGLQSSDRGETMSENLDRIDEAQSELQSIIHSLEQVLEA